MGQSFIFKLFHNLLGAINFMISHEKLALAVTCHFATRTKQIDKGIARNRLFHNNFERFSSKF